MPIAGVIITYMIPATYQKLDNGFTNDNYVTKQSSMSKYKEIYGGASYTLHFKYSEFLNVTFICMMYGVGIPILFPVAVVYFLIAYVCERISLAFLFKMPPAIGMTLTNEALGHLEYAPLLLVTNAYWMLGNH